MDQEPRFTHINERGQARMVDISGKAPSQRLAIASGTIHMEPAVAEAIKAQQITKGDVLQVARIAGIMASKKTFELIPLCHVLALTNCEIEFSWEGQATLEVQCTAKTVGTTGVEMEALTGATVALLTIYDMCKALDRQMVISSIRLLEKAGGKSGHMKVSSKGLELSE